MPYANTGTTQVTFKHLPARMYNKQQSQHVTSREPRVGVSPRARGVLFVLKGPYDPRVPPIVKFSQESESARLTKIILSKSTVKTL